MGFLAVLHLVERENLHRPPGALRLFDVGGQARLEDVLVDGEQAGKPHPHPFDVVGHIHLHRNAVLPDFEDLPHVGDARDAEPLGQLRPDLGGVAVGRLLAAEEQVELAEPAHPLREGVARGEHVRAAEPPVGEEHPLVRAHGVGLADDRLGLRRPHADDRHLPAAPLPQAQGGLERVEVVGVHLGIHPAPLDGAGHRVDVHLVGPGDLFDAHENIHLRYFPFIRFEFSSKRGRRDCRRPLRSVSYGALTTLSSLPIPPISTETRSPGRIGPMPRVVPVRTTSPGSRVMTAEM